MNDIIKFSENRVWRTYAGGKMLDHMAGKGTPQDTHFPEDWIGSTVEARNIGREHIVEGLSQIPDDHGGQIAFRDWVQQHQTRLLGESPDGPYTLEDIPLVKYLDSATRLHFQVHPTRTFAQQRLGAARGKTEAYVILAIREDVKNPYIYAGFQRPPSRATLKQWIETQNITAIEQCFDRIPVKPGDVFLIPGGRPHALGEGILMLEIMEPSDLAVRFEFERDGYVIPPAARFMNRNIETALDVFNFDPVPPEQIDHEFRCTPQTLIQDEQGNQLALLVGKAHTPCFTIKRAWVEHALTRHNPAFFIGVVTQGEGAIETPQAMTPLKKWDRFFCPANIDTFHYTSKTGMSVLECYPGLTT